MKSIKLQQIHILGGECKISASPETVFVTVLGSCVSACIYDPLLGVGGMNHFILPTGAKQAPQEAGNRYGEVAMQTLVNGLIRRGAKRERLVAKLYGGRSNSPQGAGPGIINALFAREFLHEEDIPVIDARLGDDLARWVTFVPTTGEVTVREAADPNAVRVALPKTFNPSRTKRIAC